MLRICNIFRQLNNSCLRNMMRTPRTLFNCNSNYILTQTIALTQCWVIFYPFLKT